VFGLLFLDPYVNPGVHRSSRLLHEDVDQIIAPAAERKKHPHSLLHLLLEDGDQK
jgi:hypothetical protein